jgi:hypothetical protein
MVHHEQSDPFIRQSSLLLKPIAVIYVKMISANCPTFIQYINIINSGSGQSPHLNEFITY